MLDRLVLIELNNQRKKQTHRRNEAVHSYVRNFHKLNTSVVTMLIFGKSIERRYSRSVWMRFAETERKNEKDEEKYMNQDLKVV